jgi:hypothetical protein
MAVERLNKSNYPNLDPADSGQYPNIGYGEIDNVRTHAIVAGAASTIQSDLTTTTISFDVADASYYPSTPFIIQINDERMQVTNVATNTFTVTRGYDNTEATIHKKNNVAFEVLTEYVYLVADHPVKEIKDVYIDTVKQISSTYTAYTGQSGDEHTDWPRKAVVAFTVEGFLGQQRNIEDAGDVNAGEFINQGIKEAHPRQILEKFSVDYVEVYGVAWAEYDVLPGGGAVIDQEYFAFVKNDSGADITISIIVTESNILKAKKDFLLESGDTETFNIKRTGGNTNDVVKVISSNGNGPFKINEISKTVRKKPERYGRQAKQTATHRATIKNFSFNQGSNVHWIEYQANTDALNVVEQEHRFNINLTTPGKVRLAAVNIDNTLVDYIDYNYQTTGSKVIVLKHKGGNWETQGRLVFITAKGIIRTSTLTWPKNVTYETIDTQGSILSASSSSHIVIGDNISVDAKFALDETGDYGGVGNLIERPDWVIKHFLVTQKGAALVDIDSTSFAAAGSLYAAAISGGYKLAFIWDLSFDEDRMAFESRSVIYMTAGKYYLDFIPDAAPAVVMTIDENDVIGEDPVFNHGKIEELFTDYTAKFGIKQDGSWIGIVTSVDAGNKYGTRKQEETLRLINLEAMAQDVLDNVLLQHQALYKTINLVVSWKYQELQIGDTFDIVSSLHNGKKFFIESLIINENKTLTIMGKEWW